MKLRKMIACLAACTMLFGAVQPDARLFQKSTSITAHAEITDDGFLYSKRSNGIHITGYTGTATEIVIPSQIDHVDVVDLETTFKDNTKITKITIPGTVKSISMAFDNCSTLKEVVIKDGVEEIGLYAFRGCTALSSVTIPESVSFINNGAFRGCSALEYISIPEGVTEIAGSAFRDCISLKEISLPDSLTTIGNLAFRHCASLTTIDIPDGVTEIKGDRYDGSTYDECYAVSVINIGAGIRDLTYLPLSQTTVREINVSPLNPYYYSVDGILYDMGTGDVIQIPYLHGKEDVTPEDPGSYNPESDFQYMDWQGGTKITAYVGTSTEVIIPIELGGKKVNDISSTMFRGNKKITKVSVPGGVTDITGGSFEGCTSLKEVILRDGVKTLGYSVFKGCRSLTDISLPETLTKIGLQCFEDCTSMTEIHLPDSLIEIDNAAFRYCSGLRSIVIPDKVAQIKGSSDYTTFEGCTGLTSVTIGASLTDITYFPYKESSVREINVSPDNTAYSAEDGILYNKNKTELIRVPYAKAAAYTELTLIDKVKTIRADAFNGIGKLTKITVGTGLESLENLPIDQKTLASIVVPAGNTVFSSKDGILYDYNKKRLIKIPYASAQKMTVLELLDSVEFISEGAVDGTDKITSIEIGKGLRSLDHVPFEQKTLKEINVSAQNSTYSSLNGDLYSRDKSLLIQIPFVRATGLTVLDIVDDVHEIRSGALTGADRLKTINIGSGLESVAMIPYSLASLQDINVSGKNKNYASDSGVLFDKTLNELIKFPCSSAIRDYVIPDTVSKLQRKSFFGAGKLRSVKVPDNVTSVGSKSLIASNEFGFLTEGTPDTSFIVYAKFGSTADRYARRFKMVHSGDINSDNEVSVADLVYMQRYLLGSLPMTEAQSKLADVNLDGRVDVFDLCTQRKAVIQSKIDERPGTFSSTTIIDGAVYTLQVDDEITLKHSYYAIGDLYAYTWIAECEDEIVEEIVKKVKVEDNDPSCHFVALNPGVVTIDATLYDYVFGSLEGQNTVTRKCTLIITEKTDTPSSGYGSVTGGTCPRCRGTGVFSGSTCILCDGSGTV